MKLKYFTESSYDKLYDEVEKRIDIYSSDSNKWIQELFDKKEYFKESRIDVALPTLSNPTPEGDYMNAIYIHSAFKDRISPKQASNPFLWTYLTHCEYWDYTVKRWQRYGKRTSESSIKDHFFCGPYSGSRIGFLRNSISRLWWTAELSYQEGPARYELTEIMFSNSDLCQSIIERNFSMNKNVVTGILKSIKKINDDPNLPNVDKDKNGEYEWRGLCKYINRYGAVTLLDALSSDDILEISYNYLLENRK